MTITVDGTTHTVGVQSIQRSEQKEYKYDLITEDGRRRSELRARFPVYTLLIGNINQAEYDAFRDVFDTNDLVHTVALPYGQEMIEIEATTDIGEDAISFMESDGTVRWDNLTLTITGVNPL